MTDNPSAKVSMWLSEPIPTDVLKVIGRLARADDVCHIAVMPDVHLAGEVCNGLAIATKELIYPEAVGGDIGCGMLAVACDLAADALSDERPAHRVLQRLYGHVPSNKHVGNTVPAQLPAELMRGELSSPTLEKLKSRDGRLQLGTLGRGNHFVELQSDGDGRLWLMLHSGSRAMGQAITDWHLHRAKTGPRLRCLDASRDEGLAYLSDLKWAIEYAIQNRLAMAQAVEVVLRDIFATALDWSTLIHCHHNHVRREAHLDQSYLVHRKGALPAGDRQPGVIPGSMGTRSFHVAGRGIPDSLNSSSHGAGRAIPRHEARRRISQRDLRQQMRAVWFDERRSDALRDEAPSAYQEIGRVMRSQRELTRIVRELKPVLVYKGN